MTARLRLPDGTQWVHPVAAQEALTSLWTDAGSPPSDPRWLLVREALYDLLHIARYPAGTERIVRQVRLYRRAVRAADRAGGAR